MKLRRWTGVVACIILIFSCTMHWAWYPDIKLFFTGFFSQNNYYGRPGILLCFFGGTGIIFYLLKKTWSDRLNLIFSAIAVAYAITSYLRFTSGYDGFLPEKQPGIYLMLFSAITHMIMAFLISSMEKVITSYQLEPAEEKMDS